MINIKEELKKLLEKPKVSIKSLITVDQPKVSEKKSYPNKFFNLLSEKSNKVADKSHSEIKLQNANQSLYALSAAKNVLGKVRPGRFS